MWLKDIDELNQEVKFSNKEKAAAVAKAKESLKQEAEKIRADAHKEKTEEINRFKRINKDLEDEIQRLKVEQQQNVDKVNNVKFIKFYLITN